MPKATVDYLNARRDRAGANTGGKNYRKVTGTTEEERRRHEAARDAELDVFERARVLADMRFGRLRAECREWRTMLLLKWEAGDGKIDF